MITAVAFTIGMVIEMHYGSPAKVKPILSQTQYSYENKSRIPC